MRGCDDTWTSTLKSAALALLRRIHARCRTWPALRANGAGQQSPTSTWKSSPHMEQGQYLGAGTMSPQADDAHLHKERGTTRAGTVATTTSPSIPTAAMQIPMRHPTRALSPLLPSISILVSPAQPRTQSFTTTVWCRAGQSPAANKKAIAIAGGGPCSQFATTRSRNHTTGLQWHAWTRREWSYMDVFHPVLAKSHPRHPRSRL